LGIWERRGWTWAVLRLHGKVLLPVSFPGDGGLDLLELTRRTSFTVISGRQTTERGDASADVAGEIETEPGMGALLSPSTRR
jgi:hypothetical protein